MPASKGVRKAKNINDDAKNGGRSSTVSVPPNWPVLKPLVPSVDLELEVVLPDQIVLIRKLFTSSLCRQFVSFLSSLPLITTPKTPRSGDALRVNDRIEYNDFTFAQKLWHQTALKDIIANAVHHEGVTWGGEVCGLNPRIRIYRYSSGQFFAQHYDESNDLLLPTLPPTRARSTWTLLIYLTGRATGCLGGETVFYPEPRQMRRHGLPAADSAIKIEPEEGMVLLHKHGDDCMLHEGLKVLGGEKWILRSDLCVSR